MKKKYNNKEFRKGIAFGAGFVFVVMLVALVLSKTKMVTGHQESTSEKSDIEYMSSCSAMHEGMKIE